ncbi:transcription factor bHLH118 [Lactuca sativa]|uniref:BHLH domain-containing protein n=1 Tax=Lactuca sativa TaxID=4236 RepID=A0A9R1UG64_LACSA|nr:transcription factor bHLH118 [Lactuca sativa]KAJ0186507.1 hypothetical protein LSAT_V11C900478230 [Lactuca sativa]
MDLPNTKHNQIIFSLQQSDDLVIHDHPYLISFHQEDHTHDEHLSMVDGMCKTRKRAGCRASSKPTLGSTCGGGDGEDDQTQKKMVHREIERQRRQEMSQLYASLRGLLPIEFVKGNRSVSDHMNQAVHYIKQKEESIKEISTKRDRLKKPFDTNESSMNQLSNTVSVKFCNGGVEILINSCSIEEGFALSQVLDAVMEEGLNIVSCSSTKVNNRLLHSIRSEVSEKAFIDPLMLQQRLVLVANTQSNFI